MGLDDAYFRDPESVSVSKNDADEWQRYEVEYHQSISTIILSIRGDHIAKVVDHSVDACCDSSRHHLAACCPNVDAVDVSYEVEALGCIHDLKGEVVMHERRRIGRRRSTRTLHTTIPPTLIINGMIM